MTSILSDPLERTRFIRFAIVGAIGTIIDFTVMNTLINLFSLSLVLAGTISFIAAVISNFTWNRLWTFPDSRSKPLLRQMLEFSLVSVVGIIIRIPTLAILEPIVYRLVENLNSVIPLLENFSPKVISDNITLAITIVIVLFWNFIANRYWTFSDVK
jgi:putative flippase GtrA